MGEAAGGGEYGRMPIRITRDSQLYANEPDLKQLVWMSHGDEVTDLPSGFATVATSEQVIPLQKPLCHCRYVISRGRAVMQCYFPWEG